MPGVGFEATIPVFDRAKTVQALDRVATVIGKLGYAYAIMMLQALPLLVFCFVEWYADK
jgi:hypothetical protein